MKKLLHMDIVDFWSYILGRGLTSIIIFVVGFLIIQLIAKIENRALNKQTIDKSLHKFIISATKILLYIILSIMILQNCGVSTSSLLAVLGSMGVAIALALKDSLGNVAGGIIIILTHPFKHQDHIELKNIAGVEGVVDNIDLLTTQIHTFDNQVLTIPNGTLATSVISNYSKAVDRRLSLEFGVGYDSDLEQVKNILLKIASENSEIHKIPEPTVGVVSQGASSVNLELKVWTTADKIIDIRYYIMEKSKLEFDKAGISIPYPQMDIHMKGNFTER